MSQKSNATKSILKVAKLAGLNAQIAVLEAHNEQPNDSPRSIIFANKAGSMSANKKNVGKTLRKFRDDCTEYADLNIATVNKENHEEVWGVGQLFIAFINLADDISALTIKTSKRVEEFTDKQIGELILKYRDYVIEQEIGDLSNATKEDDEMFGAEFINYFNFAKMAEVQPTVEKKNTVLKIVRPTGHEVEMTAGELGYFVWSLLDDLYLAKGMKYIKKTIGDGFEQGSDTKKQMELAGRFLYVLGFETNEIQGDVDQFAKIKSLLAAA